jgi:hypothetical protein
LRSDEAWRLECEARHILAMPTRDARQKALRRREEMGRDTRSLRAEMMRIWELERQDTDKSRA